MSNLAKEIVPGVAYLPIIFVNVYFVGELGKPWVLVDTGIPGKADLIRAAAEERFGTGARPQAIVLTHGHYDHAGSALELAQGWDVPVFAHPLELPYLTGASTYPPRDPTVGGAIAFMSRFMPSKGCNLGTHVRPLPPHGALLGMVGWRWIETPGHSPGHVSLFRAADRTLLGGDALATMDMDSWVGMTTKKQELGRAGAPFNVDWDQTRQSVARLAEMEPNVIACGHGTPMSGGNLPEQLHEFSRTFTPPSHGRYVEEPARTDENGIVALPPPVPDPLPKILAGVGLLSLASLLVVHEKRRD